MGGYPLEYARMKTLPTLLLSTTASLALSVAAHAQTPSPAQPGATPPIVSPPPGEGPQPGTGAVPKGQQPPVMDPAEVPPTQGDTVAPPATTPPPVDPSAPPRPATGASALVSGATVKDAQGNAIGTIDKVGAGASAGQVTLKVDGKSVMVDQSVLSEAGGAVVSSQTKAQILSAADARPKKKN